MLENLKQQLLIMRTQLNPPPRYIIVHHSATDGTLLSVNEYHRQKWSFKSSLGWYAGYGYWIDFDGRITQLRDDREEQAATIGFNKCSINICCRGNLDIEQPSAVQIKALNGLISKKQLEYKIPNNNILGHREIANTLCPGKYLFNWLCKNYPSSGFSGRIKDDMRDV